MDILRNPAFDWKSITRIRIVAGGIFDCIGKQIVEYEKGDLAMGFFDRDVRNSFDRRFDLNRDGKLDMKERALQYEYLERISEVVDLEFTALNKAYKEERKISRYETIQIGAVKLNEKNELIDRFSTLVKPAYSEIQAKVSELTHISDALVKNAPSFPKALNDFLNWVDFQLLVGNLLGIKQQLSLSNALRGTGIVYVGSQHSALDDAENTAELFRLTQDAAVFREKAGDILDLLEPTRELTFSMGELFKNIKID